jgi:hypothetical protein
MEILKLRRHSIEWFLPYCNREFCMERVFWTGNGLGILGKKRRLPEKEAQPGSLGSEAVRGDSSAPVG